MSIGSSNKLIMGGASPSDPSYKLNKLNLDLGIYSYTYPGIYQGIGVYQAATFSSDGTYMYCPQSGSNFIGQAISSIPYSYPYTKIYSNSTSTTNLAGGFMKSDGTRLWTIAGTGPSSLRQVNISTPFDLNTAGATTSVTVSAAGSGDRYGVFFNSDGTKLYISSNGSKTVEQYSLNSAWDVTAGITYDNKQLSLGSQVTVGILGSVWIKSDGLKLWAVAKAAPAGGQTTVYEYTISTAWDISTATYTGRSLVTSLGSCAAVGFKDDGTYIYFILSPDSAPYAIGTINIPLSSAWDISTAGTAARYTYGLSLSLYQHVSGYIMPGGNYILMGGGGGSPAIQLIYTSTPWNFTTVLPGPGILHTAGGTPVIALVKNNDTKAYVFTDTYYVYEYTLSVPKDLNSATYTGNSLLLSGVDPAGVLDISGDGTKLISIQTNGTVKQYSMSTAWNLSTASYTGQYTLSGLPSTNGFRLTYAYDGSKVVIDNNGKLYTYPLSTYWDVSTAGTPSISTSPTYLPRNIGLINFGNYLYAGSTGYGGVYQLTTTNDVSSGAFSSKIFRPPEALAGNWFRSLEFNSTGTAVYTYYIGYVRKYTLTTPWDMSTASLNSSASGLVTGGYYMSVINEEHILVFTGYTNLLYHYKMTVPGNLSTITLIGSYSFTACRAGRFSADGNYLYIVVDSFNVYSYPLSTPFNISTAGTRTTIGDSGSITDAVTLAGPNEEYMLLGSYSSTYVAQYKKTAPGTYGQRSATMRLLKPELFAYNDWINGLAWVGGQGLRLGWMTSGFTSVSTNTYIEYNINI